MRPIGPGYWGRMQLSYMESRNKRKMINVKNHELRPLCVSILQSAGAPLDIASTVVDSLLDASLRGYDSHGIVRIPQYVQDIHAGQIQPSARPSVINEGPAFAVINGNYGFGPLAGRLATEVAINKASRIGLAMVCIRSTNHLGRIGEYPERIARNGLVGLAFSNALTPRVAPFGGARACLSPEVISVAAPIPVSSDCEDPFLLDITCSVIPEGKVRLCRNQGIPLPEGAVIDAAGRPTTDPAAYYGPPEGALLPMGGPVAYKGYGLGLVCELLAGAMGGTGCSGESEEEESGLFLLAVDPAVFVPMERFSWSAVGLFERVKSCPTASGVESVLIPGEIESRTARIRKEEGIPIDDETWKRLAEAADESGYPINAPTAKREELNQ